MTFARQIEALDSIIFDPIRKRSPALGAQRLAAFLHDRSGGRLNGPVTRAIRHLRPKVTLPRSRFMDDSNSAVSFLRQNGYAVLPWRLPQTFIDQIKQFAFSSPAYAISSYENVMLQENNLPHENPRYVWPQTAFIRVPAVQQMLSDSLFCQIAQTYLGCRPILTSVQLWLDPAVDKPRGYHSYHYDNDAPHFLKFFMYLADVGAETGPHAFIAGTHTKKPHQFRRAQLYDKGQLLDYYGNDKERIFYGAASTIIAEDTAGFHRGIAPRERYRFLIQIEFSVIDIPHPEEFEIGIEPVEIAGLDANIKSICRKFLKRS